MIRMKSLIYLSVLAMLTVAMAACSSKPSVEPAIAHNAEVEAKI